MNLRFQDGDRSVDRYQPFQGCLTQYCLQTILNERVRDEKEGKNKRRRFNWYGQIQQNGKDVIVEVTRTFSTLVSQGRSKCEKLRAYDELGCNVGDRSLLNHVPSQRP